jgi:hypothetical protein
MMQNSNAIITQEDAAIEGVKRLMNIVIGLSNDVFKDGVDFGAIPGTGDKPVLLQPGMEKLLRALHLRAEYVERSKVEDFDKSLFFYRYECRLIDWETGICVGTAIGSANSHESKWRWREGKRVCPTCGKDAIIKGKEEYGGGWICFAKKGGCGAKFKEKDPAIIDQAVGRIENPDIFDQMNTCDKIAQKRALGSAIKTVANVSMLYTVDLEDFTPYDTRPLAGGDVIEGTFTEVGGKNEPSPVPVRQEGIPPNGDGSKTTPPTQGGATGSSAKDDFFSDDAPAGGNGQPYTDFLCHELVYTVTNGGSQYTFKSEHGAKIVVFGSDWVLTVADYENRDVFKNTPGKVQTLRPPMVVRARFDNSKKTWDVEQVTTLEAVTR